MGLFGLPMDPLNLWAFYGPLYGPPYRPAFSSLTSITPQDFVGSIESITAVIVHIEISFT